MESERLVDTWFERFPLADSTSITPRYRAHGMQKIPQSLTEGLTVHQSTRVDRIYGTKVAFVDGIGFPF